MILCILLLLLVMIVITYVMGGYRKHDFNATIIIDGTKLYSIIYINNCIVYRNIYIGSYVEQRLSWVLRLT